MTRINSKERIFALWRWWSRFAYQQRPRVVSQLTVRSVLPDFVLSLVFGAYETRMLHRLDKTCLYDCQIEKRIRRANILLTDT